MTKITIETKKLDQIARSLNRNVQDVLEALAFDVEASAKQRAPYDTTALRNSIYTITKRSNGYDAASSAAANLRPGVSVEPHPPVSGKVIARVGPCVEYGAFVELGTDKMSARPFLVPALEETAKTYASGKKWRKIVE